MSTDPERHVLVEGKFIRAVTKRHWEWVERTNTAGAAVIAAVTADRCLVLVEQYRIPVESRVVELPAGLVGDDAGCHGEEQAAAARRELLEETGYQADRLEYLTEGPASSGLASEIFTLFLAHRARKVAPGGGEGAEEIEVHVVPLDLIDDWLVERRRQGRMLDSKIYTALYFINRRGIG